MLHFLASSMRRSAAFRSRARFSSFAAAEKDRGVSDRDLGALGRVVVGALGIGGSGLALWMVTSLSPFSDSSISFADSGTEWSEPDIGIAPDDVKMEKKVRYLFADSYRRRVFFKYEKRIRTQSSPEKIFEYFASSQNSEGEICMTPADLMKAIVPVFPPSESNIVRQGFLKGECDPGELQCAPSNFFMLFDTNNDGLISFPEYIFFVTLLSIPESSFSVAFKMFDLDNNGEIEREEFKKVMALMRSYNRQGASHTNGLRIGLKVGGSIENGGLVEYFFGEDGKGCLRHDKFVKFLRDLHDEIVHLEFAHYDFTSRGSISAKDFALSMVASADMNHINKLLDQVDELDNTPSLRDKRITFEEFKAFDELRKKLRPLTLAIFSYGKVNGLLTKQDFIRAASHVCGVSLTQNVVDVIFHVFDANCDGNLSSEEFLRALQRQEVADVHLPRSRSVMGFLSCLLSCSKR
ncbi:calcium uptake protein 1, mitochondrial isoform X1 [Canna indica]|uniref:Calcium uptake protein 1, mitochondrial isoform X1 n=1 Tax=Canna indica TaxID=4628 RepID=A0AAQ3JZL0_9LILI|nr:calcium uptake protein 1, mitochondrial isoform X1 [Canna indica]